jgi:ABC-2 type transport system permease protein
VILPIIKKEFLQIIRDRRTLAVLFLIPLFLLIMFGYAISLDVKHISIAVVDLDKGSESRSFLDELRHTGYFDIKFNLNDMSRIDPKFSSSWTDRTPTPVPPFWAT